MARDINKQINSFFESKWIYIFIFFMLLTISIAQIIEFVYFGGDIGFFWDKIGNDRKIYFRDENSYIAWILFTISFIGYYFTFIGLILLINHKKNFIYYTIFGETFLFAFNFMIGLFFTLIPTVFFMIIPIINLKHWNKEQQTNTFESELTTLDRIKHALFTSLYISIGVPLALYVFKEGIEQAIFDVVGSSILITAWYLTTRKSKWGFVEFLISDIIYITLFTVITSWVSLMSYSLFFIIDVLVLIDIWGQPNLEETHIEYKDI